MTGAVNMTIVARVGFILDVSGIDRDTTGLFFRRLVDFGVICELGATAVGENLSDGGRQGCLAMVNMTLRCARESATVKRLKGYSTYGPYVHMRLGPRELGAGAISIATHGSCQGE
jgi:hypothetical protein